MAIKEFGTRGETTVIGQSILISGKLTGDEDLTVRGRVEGELNLSKTLIVEPSGIVKADVSVRNAIVSGVVVGNIAATESIELTQEGRMVGDIRSPRVIVVEGASFKGRIDMGQAEGRSAGERGAKPVIRATVRSGAPIVRPVSKPIGAKAKAVAREEKPMPPPPPSVPVVAAVGKKKVVLKRKK